LQKNENLILSEQLKKMKTSTLNWSVIS